MLSILLALSLLIAWEIIVLIIPISKAKLC